MRATIRMPEPLEGRRAVILVDDLYEDLELTYPRLRLLEEGVHVVVAGLKGVRTYTGKRGTSIEADAHVDDVARQTWDLVVIPGGWAPDKLRMSQAVKSLVRKHHQAGRPIAAICHAGWVLASADVLRGATVTGFESIWDDMRNAGATVVDKEVVVDHNLITSRTPADLPAFMRETIRVLGKGVAKPSSPGKPAVASARGR